MCFACCVGCCGAGGVEVLVQLVLVVLHLPYLFCTMYATLSLYSYFTFSVIALGPIRSNISCLIGPKCFKFSNA